MKPGDVESEKHGFGELVAALVVGTVKGGRVAAALHPVQFLVPLVLKFFSAVASNAYN